MGRPAGGVEWRREEIDETDPADSVNDVVAVAGSTDAGKVSAS
jgi:hypothetical protein